MKQFYKKRKRSKAKEEALDQIRKTRKQILSQHPEILNRIQLIYMENRKRRSAPVKKKLSPQDIEIDHNKMIETVTKFLELSNSETMNKKIKSVLSGRVH